MEMRERWVTVRDGHTLYVRTWTIQEAKGHVHILHGMAEHSGRYVEFAQMLVELGYNVSTHDARGHGETGKNSGVMGHLANKHGAALVVQDVADVIDEVKTTERVILFGHSMGSFIARRFTQLYSERLAGAIFCATGSASPLHMTASSLAKMLVATKGPQSPATLLDQLNSKVFNQNILNPQTPYDWLSTDILEVKKYMEDPLCGFCPSNQFYVDLLQLMLETTASANDVHLVNDVPILFIAGEEDAVGDYSKGVFKAAQQMEAAGVQDVAVYLFSGMRHEILNEKNKQHVYDVVKWWLNNDRKKH